MTLDEQLGDAAATHIRDRLKLAIARSGLSNSAFARQVLVRDPRSLRRWLAGGAIPEAVIQWLAVKLDTS